MHFRIKPCLLALLLFVSGCSTLLPSQALHSTWGQHGLNVNTVIDTRTGRAIPFESFIGELSNARVIYAGEVHTSKEDHRVQLEILQALHRKNPKITVALEMFPREAQPVLSSYTAGNLTEEQFLEDVNWERIWGLPYSLYQPIISFARDNGLKLLGLNAPREVVRKIGQSGLQSLSAEDRRRIAADFHLDDPEHREYVRKQYEAHLKGSIGDFETFYEAQLAWEETMAETLAHELAAASPQEQFLVIVGKGHFSDRVGMPVLTARRVPHVYRTVAPVPVNYPMSATDPDLADFVWITEKMEFPHHRRRLGVLVRATPSGEGLEVLDVIPGSPAEKGGILPHDVLMTIGDTTLTSVGDVQKALLREEKTFTLKLKRKGWDLSLEMVMPQDEGS